MIARTHRSPTEDTRLRARLFDLPSLDYSKNCLGVVLDQRIQRYHPDCHLERSERSFFVRLAAVEERFLTSFEMTEIQDSIDCQRELECFTSLHTPMSYRSYRRSKLRTAPAGRPCPASRRASPEPQVPKPAAFPSTDAGSSPPAHALRSHIPG